MQNSLMIHTLNLENVDIDSEYWIKSLGSAKKVMAYQLIILMVLRYCQWTWMKLQLNPSSDVFMLGADVWIMPETSRTASGSNPSRYCRCTMYKYETCTHSSFLTRYCSHDFETLSKLSYLTLLATSTLRSFRVDMTSVKKSCLPH